VELPKLLEALFAVQCQKAGVISWSYTGSREICPGSETEQSDYDVICFVSDLPESDHVYDKGGHDNELVSSVKWSLSAGCLNLLFTDNEGFFNRFILATNVAREMKLSKRSDRVILFQAILYGTHPHRNTQPVGELSLNG